MLKTAEQVEEEKGTIFFCFQNQFQKKLRLARVERPIQCSNLQPVARQQDPDRALESTGQVGGIKGQGVFSSFRAFFSFTKDIVALADGERTKSIVMLNALVSFALRYSDK